MHGNARITHENDQIIPFFILTILLLGLMLAVSLQIGRIVYARGEVSKAADAAALAAASQLDLAAYRETGQIVFLPNTPAMAQDYAHAQRWILGQTWHWRFGVTDLGRCRVSAGLRHSHGRSGLASTRIPLTPWELWRNRLCPSTHPGLDRNPKIPLPMEVRAM
jgi:hypothetical protein